MEHKNSYIENFEELTESFSSILDTISYFKIQMTELQNNIRKLEKKTKKSFKKINKELEKKKKQYSTKKPSGFAKPCKVSNELCDFMNKPNGTELARTEVTQYIIQYIKDNNLQNQENKKYIKADNKLYKLLDLNENDTLTYFNLQSYMNKHFL